MEASSQTRRPLRRILWDDLALWAAIAVGIGLMVLMFRFGGNIDTSDHEWRCKPVAGASVCVDPDTGQRIRVPER